MTLQSGDEGVDLASYQHPGGLGIDYKQLAGAKKFAYVQLTDSTNYQNPYCVTDSRGCQGAGMATGAYHFWRPDDSFDQQVNDFTKLYLAIGGFTLPPMIDCETESANGWAWTANQLGLLQTNLRTALGTDVGVYLNDSFYQNMPGCPWGWPLWLADPSHPNAPTYPCTLQQVGTGSVPGIAAATDLDIWRTSLGPPPKEPTVALSETVESNNQTHLTQVSNGTWYHKWWDTAGWHNEVFSLPAGKTPTGTPRLFLTGANMVATVEDQNGVAYAATSNAAWAVTALP